MDMKDEVSEDKTEKIKTTIDPIIVDQYKMMVATTSEVTKNRQSTNSFYLDLEHFPPWCRECITKYTSLWHITDVYNRHDDLYLLVRKHRVVQEP